MASAGWYPDPGGAPGRYRYWDGQRWSAETVGDPGRGAPTAPGTPGAAAGPPANRGRRRAGPWVAVLALLVVVAVVVTLVVRSGSRDTADPGPLPTSSVPGRDDTSPTPFPVPTASASPTPSPTPTPGSPTVPCPQGDPLARQPHPADNRVHGGGLSIPSQPGWASPGQQATGFTWAYDVGETDTNVQPTWFAAYAVGALSVVDGFEAPRVAAELAMTCTVGSSFYKNVTSRRDLSSRAVTVDGQPGWTIRTEIRVDNDETTFEGDVVQITVVDVDAPESLAFFWGCAPIGDTALVARLDAAARQLRVD